MRGGRRERAGGSGVSERPSRDGVHPPWEQRESLALRQHLGSALESDGLGSEPCSKLNE